MFVAFLVLLPICVGVASVWLGAVRGALLGFDVAAFLFVAAVMTKLSPAGPESLRLTAAGNDAGRGLLLAVSAILSIVVLVAVGVELGRRDPSDSLQVLLIAATLALAWLFANLVYALHYAHMYYDPGHSSGDREGLVFPGRKQPDFWDFCYFAFVLGMTFQVSDVQITSSSIRRIAVLHGLLAFFFNIGVVALSVNVIASAT